MAGAVPTCGSSWYVFEFFYYGATIAPVSPADQAGARVPDLEG